jgi:hypothetical protein
VTPLMVQHTMTTLTANAVLDSYFLEARCKLLDLAAILDRIERGSGSSSVAGDLRMTRIHRAIETLQAGGTRAERVQQIFSLDYDPNWKRPEPRDRSSESSTDPQGVV